MWKKFKATYNTKVYDSDAVGLITPYATGSVNFHYVRNSTIVRAKTSRRAREKIRAASGYSITSIQIEEVTSKWMKKLNRWLKKLKK